LSFQDFSPREIVLLKFRKLEETKQFWWWKLFTRWFCLSYFSLYNLTTNKTIIVQ